VAASFFVSRPTIAAQLVVTAGNMRRLADYGERGVRLVITSTSCTPTAFVHIKRR
jgi:hypothetical protein